MINFRVIVATLQPTDNSSIRHDQIWHRSSKWAIDSKTAQRKRYSCFKKFDKYGKILQSNWKGSTCHNFRSKKKKFHRMILRRKFLLQPDHRPLLSIFGSKKGIPMHAANGLLWFYWTMISRWNFYHRKNLDMWMACPDIKM